MKLSILIASLPDRTNHLANMMALLQPQLTDEVEVLVDDTGRHQATGTKRNHLIERARGEWFCFVDDDDWINPSYVSLILKALESNPDVVTFCGWYTENGRNRLDWTIKLGEKYEARTENGKYQIFRWPNHLTVMRKSCVGHVKFPDIWHGEDYKWSEQIKNLGLLKTEVHIPEQIYWYQYVTGK